jgi:hypothetical protein
MGVAMPDKEPDILAQFAEFLEAKKEHEKEAAASEDFEVEIWDEKGKGVRTKRSHAKPFLQSLGLDLDDESSGDEGDNRGDNEGDKSKSTSSRKSTGKQSTNVAAGGVARKYFTAGKPSK